MCSPVPLRRRGPRRPPPNPPPEPTARAKPALERARTPYTIAPRFTDGIIAPRARRSSRCARPCRSVGGGLDGPLRTLPQNRRRGRSPRSNERALRTPSPLASPTASLRLAPVDHHDVLAHAAPAEGAAAAP